MSIGIIGGADGPTSVYVTSTPNIAWYFIGTALIVIVAAVAGFIVWKRKTRSDTKQIIAVALLLLPFVNFGMFSLVFWHGG